MRRRLHDNGATGQLNLRTQSSDLAVLLSSAAFSVTYLSRTPEMTNTPAPDDLPLNLPYEIAVLRPIATTTREERTRILEDAGYNTELVPQHAIYI